MDGVHSKGGVAGAGRRGCCGQLRRRKLAIEAEGMRKGKKEMREGTKGVR